MPVIQFFDLDKMLHELQPNDVVRIEPIRYVSQRHHVVELTTFGVAVRHINAQGHVLAVFIPTWHGQIWPNEDEAEDEKRQAENEDLLTRLHAHLLAIHLDVRYGLIGIGDEKLQPAAWRKRT